MDINNLLQDLIEKSIKQHSQEWNDMQKEVRVGGSSIDKLLPSTYKKNVSENINKYIIEKFKNKPRLSIPAVQWGTLFETLARQHASFIYGDIDIKECGAIVNTKYPYQHYSPDSISVDKNTLVLYEFKCPFSKKFEEKINSSYVSQMQLGMFTIPEVDHTRFVECNFRICTIEQFSSKGYEYYYLGDNKGIFDKDLQFKDNDAIKRGIIYFTSNENTSEEDLAFIYEPENPIKNLSVCELNYLHTILRLFHDNKLSANYEYSEYNYTINEILDHHNEISTEGNLVAFMPWKLLAVYCAKVTRNEIIQKQIEETLIEFEQIINNPTKMKELEEESKKKDPSEEMKLYIK